MVAKTLVSVVAPVYNEAAVIEEFVRRLSVAVESLDKPYAFEFLMVDDGSQDGSLERLKRLLAAEPRLRIIELCRNYGQTPALQAGLDAARGQILITMDADLQHFPEDIPQFLAKLEEGYDVVCGWRHQRAEGVLRRWPSQAANLIMRRLFGVGIHDVGTTYRAYNADAVKGLRLFGEFHRYIPVLAKIAGNRVTEIPIQNVARSSGRSHYGLGRTIGVALDLLLLFFLSRYVDRPLRAFGKLSLLVFWVGSAILAFLLIYAWMSGAPTVREHSGWFLMSVMMILASIQIMLTGILAEILVRVLFAQGDRRVYAIRREWRSGPLAP